MSASFDTLSYAKKLKAAGFTQEQAEVQAQALAEIVEERLATKQDIAALRQAILHDITALRQENAQDRETARRDLKDLEQRMTIRVGGMFAAAITIIVALVKLL